jgi:hypothetical protein
MPQTADILARVPPHFRKELKRLMTDLPARFRDPSYGDMVGALILAARRSPDVVHADLETYLDLKQKWSRDGIEELPDL